MCSQGDEDLNGFKLIKLLDEATITLKTFLLKFYGNDVSQLCVALKSSESKIKKILQKDQVSIVFPAKEQTDLEKYDICLIYCLLRVLQKVRKPKTGWYGKPLVTDTSEGACVVRIYISRNALYHGRLKKTSSEFKKYLDDIGKSMIELGCDIKIINDIINMNSVGKGNQSICTKEDEMRKLEDENEELLQKLEQIESCFSDEVWFGVMPLIPTFVGRKEEVEMLHDIMVKLQRGILATVLSGLPGTGKTTLACYYCYEYCESYDNNVVWLNASTKENLDSSFLSLAKHLNLVDKDTNQEAINIQILVTRIYKYFAKTKVLFVFDNCENINDIWHHLPNNLPPSVNQPSILITSQKSSWGQRFLERKMNKLSNDESIEFLQNTIPKELKTNIDDLFNLSHTLDGYPLALQQATAYIKHFSITVSEYISRFQAMDKSSTAMLQFPSEDTIYRHQLSTALELLLNRLHESKEDNVCTEVLRIISLLDGTKINADLFQNYSVKKGDINERAFLYLEELSLIRIETNHLQRTRMIVVHSLVQKFIRQSLILSNSIDIYIEKVFSLFKHIIPNDRKRKVGDWNFGNLWMHHISHMYYNLDKSLCLVQNISELKKEISDALRQKGNEDIAIQILLTIKSHYETLFGAVNKQVLDTLILLQGCYCGLRHWKDWLDIATRAEEMSLLLYSKMSDSVCTSRHTRALCLSKLGKTEEAIKIYRKLFADRQMSSIYIDGTVITAINISVELERQHRYDESLEINDYVLDVLKKMPSYLTLVEYYEVIEKRAFLFAGLGRKLEAETLLEDGIKEINAHLGQENMKTMQLKGALGLVLMKSGKFRPALNILLETCKDMENVFKIDHPVFIDLQTSLADCYERMGNLTDAIRIYNVVEAVLEVKLDTGHPEMLQLQSSRASAYFSLGQYQKAMAILNNIKNTNENLHGKNHPKVLENQSQIAYHLYMIGEYNRAMKLREETKESLMLIHGNDHVDVYTQSNWIALSLEKIGHFDEALQLHEIVYTSCLKLHGPDFPLTKGSRFNTSICWLACGKVKNALEFFLNDVVETSKMENLSSFFAKYYLLSTYVELEILDKAEEMLQLTLALGYKLFDSKHVFILRVHYQHARWEFRKNNTVEAKSKCQYILQHVIQLSKSHLLVVGTNILLAQCLFLEGFKEDAVNICNKVLESAKDELMTDHPIFTPAYKILKG